ncbi:MAG: transposase [Comamonas sp.]|nr:transposase [Comamonas sp.]
MTRPRSELVCPSATPWYHCVCRCVRRSFLCGQDALTGKDFSHRKAWILARLALLSEVFTIDLGAYAVMANHYHLVLRLDTEHAAGLSDEEVISRWKRLFSLPILVKRLYDGVQVTEAETIAARAIVAIWRNRLADISWYMRCINEPIARQANHEDGCTGRFWEGRYKSQAILDEAGLLACLVYVDLNPLRAGVVEVPEKSVDVSLNQRVAEHSVQEHNEDLPALLPFSGNYSQNMREGIPYAFADYMQLVDWTGRAQRSDKRGHIDAAMPSILNRLDIDLESFLQTVSHHQLSHGSVIGQPEKCEQRAHQLGRSRCLSPPLRHCV